MVMVENSRSEGCGFESNAIYWMDIFHINLLYNCIDVCLKRPKINEKEAGDGSFKKPPGMSKLYDTRYLL